MNLDAFDYDLPPERIAQEPLTPRDASRLLVLDRRTGDIRHHTFTELPELVGPGDLLVINDTRVLPARLSARKSTGGRAELLLLERVPGSKGSVWRCLLEASRPPKTGSRLMLGDGLEAEVLGREGEVWRIGLGGEEGDVEPRLLALGRTPLPPYIRRGPEDPRESADRACYQTVFARVPGAAAAPTAGLHFTPALLDRMVSRGVAIASVTLHVGLGTFLPLRSTTLEAVHLHDESFVLPRVTADAITRTRERGGRVVAVGTTVVRTLETCATGNGKVGEGSGRTDLFIRPGFRFQVVDALVTNFHLPRSSLLVLVAAFAGLPSVLNAYRVAVERGYRFFSYGDAMFVATPP